ncbi:MAG: ABC transporter ATP-binding protein [Nitrososphaerota archaeon]|nr:ABC transporter ATP-binding protein [Nitrososphaerales archaeon]MDW8044572.1 ABC transporter ATP-binding protein [Nitrososphaerota archaeon]
MSCKEKIVVRNLTVEYKKGVKALENVNFQVYDGEVITIIGVSGCGKTTLLNTILMLTKDEANIYGEIIIDGIDILNYKGSNIYQKLKIGYVTQRETLLPWRSALENVELGCEIRGMPKDERRKRAKELFKLVGLEGFEHRYPHELSGGMKQRISIIRSLAYDPDILLMDEPFGALDAHTRMILQRELSEILMKTKKTTIFITHDLSEAIILGNRIILLSKRPGTVKGIFESNFPFPRDPFKIQSSAEFTTLYREIFNELSKEAI